MRSRHGIALLALSLAMVSPALAGQPEELARLDEALKGVATFEHGKDAGPLRQVEGIVIAVAKDPERRDPVEQRLAQALRSATTRDAKSFLCRQLRTIGTAACVPALEPLLTDAELSHMARYALGRMEAPEAAAALHRALARTQGKLQVGVINTLGDRRYAAALPDFVKLLGSPDGEVAAAAAAALAKIGSPDCARALEGARANADGRRRLPIDHALMACADRLLADGRAADAARLYGMFYSSEAPKHFRVGAFRGLVAARGAAGAALLVQAIKSDDPELRATAIGLAAETKGQEATRTLAGLLPTLAPEGQELLLRALGQRGDPAAASAVVAAARSEQEAVRIAAFDALGSLGDASMVPLLLERAASAGGQEQQVARRSLTRLGDKGADAALVKLAGSGEAAARVEAIRALAARGARQATADLLKAARDPDEAVRREAIRALGALATEAQLGQLVQLAVRPKDPKDRGTIEQAIAAASRRVDDAEKQAAPVLAALDGAPAEAKPTLLRLLGRAATPEALAAVRAALKAGEEAVQDAAVRALADWPTPEPAEELLTLARTSTEQTHKVLALRGYVRMAGASEDPTAMYARAMELAERTDDKKLVLAGLGTADSEAALQLVEKHLDNEQLRNEAAMAAIQIADKLRRKDAKRARVTLDKVLAAVQEPAVRQKAQNIINEMEQYEGYVLQWLGSPPYQQKGKDARALFGIAFPPEEPDAKDVKWTKLTKGVGDWAITLDQAIASLDDVAAYLRTGVWSPEEQDVQLELGSDDAIKVWLNGKLIHANNANRGVGPRQDIVEARLAKGWNNLMLKVIDHQGGWAAACRIRKVGGAAIEGLKYEAKLP